MNTATLKNLVNILFFGTLMGFIMTFALSVFIPQFYTEWAGSLVCPGRIEFFTLKQTFYCYTSANEYFDLRDQMFWAVLKRIVVPVFILSLAFVALMMKLMRFLYERRAAAGF